WGAISSIVDNSGINLGTINPFRYRSYYYDEETQLYYLNSRYYNPEWKRFVNADALITGNGLNSNNLYCYCNNEPIFQEDSSGYFACFMKKGVLGGFISSITKLTSNIVLKKPIFEDVGTSFVTGFISGAIDGLFNNYFVNLGISIIFEAYNVVYGDSTITEAVCNVGIDALFGAITLEEIAKSSNQFKLSELSNNQKDIFSYITQASGEYTKNITNDTIKKSSDKKNIANNSYSKNNTIKEKLLPRKLRKPKSPPKNAREFIEMSNNKSIPSETWTTIINTINMGYCKL
ncbi:MAG: RHS repeat-associated core domain-containing protein, partial [Firmicutes bacterium]|nr:RHS repeat-associated core domain-containing protein [Bacillota bacterium]